MKIFLLDVDNTITPFQPTAELYKRSFLKERNLKHLLIGYFMILLLKLFWFSPKVVEFQRKLIMSLLSKIDPSQLEVEATQIAKIVADSYNNNFKKILVYYNYSKQAGDKVYLLTHCPQLIAEKIVKALNFDGEYSIKIDNYFKEKRSVNNINKLEILMKIKANNQKAQIFYFADDLIDVKCLLAADRGILTNASDFTKIICKIFFKKVIIWT